MDAQKYSLSAEEGSSRLTKIGDKMNPLIQSLTEGQLRTDIPSFRPGDTVRVHAKVVEGNRERIQIF